MNARKLLLAVVGTLFAFALAAAPSTRTRQVAIGAQPTPYSADHARINTPAEEQAAQF